MQAGHCAVEFGVMPPHKGRQYKHRKCSGQGKIGSVTGQAGVGARSDSSGGKVGNVRHACG